MQVVTISMALISVIFNHKYLNKTLVGFFILAVRPTSSKEASDYGHKLKSGILNNIELKFLQPETYLLYRDLMISKGTSSAQLKPPRVIVNDIHKRFFLALLDDELN